MWPSPSTIKKDVTLTLYLPRHNSASEGGASRYSEEVTLHIRIRRICYEYACTGANGWKRMGIGYTVGVPRKADQSFQSVVCQDCDIEPGLWCLLWYFESRVERSARWVTRKKGMSSETGKLGGDLGRFRVTSFFITYLVVNPVILGNISNIRDSHLFPY